MNYYNQKHHLIKLDQTRCILNFYDLFHTIVGKIPKIVFFLLELNPPTQLYWETENSDGFANHFL